MYFTTEYDFRVFWSLKLALRAFPGLRREVLPVHYWDDAQGLHRELRTGQPPQPLQNNAIEGGRNSV